MSAATQGDLSRRLDAVLEEARGRVKAFQAEAQTSYEQIGERFHAFVPVAERIAELAREKLRKLRERVEFEVTPAHVREERYYLRSVVVEVKSDLAGTIRLTFRLSHDADVRHVLLDYELEILPVFFRFEPHARLDVPLESYDEAVVDRWLDDRLVDFANAYLELHLTRQYQDRVLVADPVAGIRFPRYYAAATLEHQGTTYHFVSEETRREFATRHGLTP